MMAANPASAVALFSGGLDSILACRVIMAQGIKVRAVRFVTPFFGYDLLARQEEYKEEIAGKFGIDVQLKDISDMYIKMLRKPAHGYGKNFNPCVDCKIMIASEARAMMAGVGASFLISGEVLGQRPMSQRHDTLRVIERDSGCEGILLRPLCALNLKETLPESEGLVARGKLLAFKGRTRQPQMQLAAAFGIKEYPSPGGGCVLTDPGKGGRIRQFYEEQQEIVTNDIEALMVGRQFRLPDGGWLVMGRNEAENVTVTKLQRPGDLVLSLPDWPGPDAILRYGRSSQDLAAAAGLLKRFSRKGAGKSEAVVVFQETGGGHAGEINDAIPAEQVFEEWKR